MREERLPVDDLSFPDLRAFLDQLRRDGDLVVVEAPVDAHLEAAEIHRRVIAAGGPALLFTQRRAAPTSRWSPTSSAPRGAPSSRSAAGRARLVRRLVHAGRDAAAADAGKLWGARDVGRRGAAHRPRAPARRAGDRGRDGRRRASTACPRSPAGRRTAARSSPCRSSTPSTPTGPAHNLGMYRMQVHDARDDRHALADRQGRRLPLRGRRGARRGAAGHRLPRRPARARSWPRSRRCPRTCPS